MRRVSREKLSKYLAAVAAVAAATTLKLVAENFLINQPPFLLFFGAVTVATWFGGFGPGIVAIFLSALAAEVFFLGLNAENDLLLLLTFVVETMVLVGLSGSLREARRQAQQTESAKDEALALLDTVQIYAPVGLAFLDNDLRYVRINYAMAELNGLTPAAHLGRTLQDVQPQLDSKVIDDIKQVIQSGKPLLDQELTVVKPTMLGMKRQNLLTSYYRVRSADGKALGVGAVMVDITAIREAEEAMRESEQRFRVMADTAPVLIWMSDTSKLNTYFNQGWLDFRGRPLEQELGNGWTEGLHPADYAVWQETYSKAFEARQEFNAEYRMHRHDGEYRWVFAHGVPRYTPEGAFIGYIGSAIDITERKLHEQRQQFLTETSVMLASSLDFETTLTGIAQRCVPEMADWCAIDLLAQDGNGVNRLAVAHVDPEKVKWAYQLQEQYPIDMNMQQGLPQVLRTGKTEFYPEITEAMKEESANTVEEYELIQKIGFTSVIIAPLNVRGRTIGALTLVSAESGRHYTETDVAFAETLASRAALAVDNSRLYSEAHAERERFRVTLASIGDAVIATNADGQVTFLNRIAEDLTGWESPDALGKPLESIFNIVNEQTRAVVENPVAKVLSEGRIVGLANHTMLISRNGSEVPIDDSGAPIPTVDGEIGGVVLVFRDVTERKRIEQRQEFILTASNLLISSLDYDQTLQNITQLAVPALADWCIVHLNDEDGVPQQVALYHVDPKRRALREEMMERYPPQIDDQFGHITVVRTGEPELIENVTDDLLQATAKDEVHLRMLRELNYRSSIVVPLKTTGEVFGALTLRTSVEGRTFTRDDLALAEELGHVVSLAIENTRLYRQARDGNSGSTPD